MGSGLGLGSGLGAGFICIMSASQGPDANARVSMRTWDLRGGGGRRGERGWRRRWGWGGGKKEIRIAHQPAARGREPDEQVGQPAHTIAGTRGGRSSASRPLHTARPALAPSALCPSAPDRCHAHVPRRPRRQPCDCSSARGLCAVQSAGMGGLFARDLPSVGSHRRHKEAPAGGQHPQKGVHHRPSEDGAHGTARRATVRSKGWQAKSVGTCAPPRDQSSGG